MEQQKHAVEMDPEMRALEKAKAQAELHFQGQDYALRQEQQQHSIGMDRDRFGFEQGQAGRQADMDGQRFGLEQQNGQNVKFNSFTKTWPNSP
jgi:hypothetical protein